MSKPVVIVALLIAVVLGAVALIITARDRPVAPRGPVLGVEAAHITEIRINRSGDTWEAARRTPEGDWEIVLGSAAGERSWPADPTRARAALRILATLEFQRPASETEAGADASSVTILTDDGAKRTLRISPRALAGQVLAETGRPDGKAVGWLGVDVRDMLVGSGPKEWRDAAALSVGPDVSRITLRGAGGDASLGRVQGRWALREPVQVAAESDAVAKLTSALAAVLITDFLDRGPPSETGLDRPVASLSIESDVRDAEGAPARTMRQSLKVGQAAGVGAKGMYAAVERGGRARVVVVSADSLAAITTDPVAFVSRRSIEGGAADIAKIVVRGPDGATRTYERTLDGWAADGKPVSKADTAGINAILKLLAEDRAEAVLIGERWPGAGEALERAIGSVELQTAGGTSLAGAEFVMLRPEGQSRRVGVRVGPVWRVYEPGAAVEWLDSGAHPG